MKQAAKRIGRPIKKPTSKRVTLGLRVSRETRELVEMAAALSGRSMSQEAEMLIEQAILLRRHGIKLK